MSYKRLIPCIFILGGKAVKWFDDPTVVSEDVIALAKEYSDKGRMNFWYLTCQIRTRIMMSPLN